MANQTQRQLSTALNQFYSKPVARVSLELFLTVATVLFFAVFAIRPTLVTMSELIEELNQKQELEQALTRKIAALGTAQAQLSTNQDSLQFLSQALPTEPQFVLVLKTLEKMASNNTIVINSLQTPSIPDPNPNTNQPSFRISLNVTGNFEDIRSFVSQIVTYRRLMIVESVSFEVNEDRDQRQLRAQLQISVPYRGVNTSNEVTDDI